MKSFTDIKIPQAIREIAVESTDSSSRTLALATGWQGLHLFKVKF